MEVLTEIVIKWYQKVVRPNSKTLFNIVRNLIHDTTGIFSWEDQAKRLFVYANCYRFITRIRSLLFPFRWAFLGTGL